MKSKHRYKYQRAYDEWLKDRSNIRAANEALYHATIDYERGGETSWATIRLAVRDMEEAIALWKGKQG